MGAVVKYRDLPGGPTDVRLGEEISRHCLCTQCGMLSMSVFEDPQGHVFCSACIDEHSYKNHKYDIFCKYEQRNVLLNEMFDAKDVVTVIQDQWTFCPNKKCETAVPLKALNDHYARCMSLVQCSAGHRTVPTEEWKVHWKIHSSGSHEEPAAMEANKYQRPMESPSRNTAYQRNSQSPQPSHSQFYVPAQQNPVASPIAPTTTNARRSYGSSPQATQSSLFSTQPLRTASASSPGSLRLQITLAGGDATPKLLPCDHCGKPVKEDNMASHLDVCARVRQACVYCDTMLLKADIVAHFRQCGENPDNVSLSSQAYRPTYPASAHFSLPMMPTPVHSLRSPTPSAHFWPENTSRNFCASAAPGTTSRPLDDQNGQHWLLQSVASKSRSALLVVMAALEHGLAPALAIGRKLKLAVKSRIGALRRSPLRSRHSLPGSSKRAARRRQWH